RREEVGSDTWQAQYQQEPVPPGGYMFKRAWVQRYHTLPVRKPGSRIIQSIDTATKAGPENDYSVITTWLVQDHCYWLIHVARKRLEYPYLKAFVLENAQLHKPDKILIEDAGTGSALIQELRFTAFNVVGVRPTSDKRTRAQIVAAKFESGKVFLPFAAPWLPELEEELFSFSQSRHDDQIDSISQALSEAISSYDPGALAEGLARIFAPPVWNVIY
ncbi:MAG: phage terminase large subunit, partial [Nitrobacter sp.]